MYYETEQIFYCLFTFYFSLLTASARTWEELMQETGKYLSQQNKDSALACSDRALKIAISTSPSKHALSLGMIGQIYFDYGNYDKAAEYFMSEKNLKQTFLGKSNPSYAVSLNNLSSAYQYLGKYEEAEQLLLEAIEIKNAANIKDTILAKSYHNLGKLYHSIGMYGKSEENYIKALDIKKEMCGESHPLYANTLYNLGLLYKSYGNFQNAEKNLQQSYNIYRKYNDKNLMRQVELQLAMVYNEQNKAKEFSEIMSKYKSDENIDLNSPDAGNTLYELALLNVVNKDYKNAESLLLKAKPSIEKQNGKTSTVFLSCLNALGIISWIQGDLNKAYKYLNQVVSLREVFFGDKHPEYATAIHNLAGLQIEMKEFGQADRNYSEALSIYLSLIKNYFPFLSESEKARFSRSIKERFDMFYNYVLQRKDENPKLIGAMFNNRLAAKSILLNNSIAINNKIKSSGDASLINDYDKLVKIKEQLSVAYRMNKKEALKIGINTDSLETAANQLEKIISGKSSEFKDEYQKNDITWKDIQSHLGNDEAAVEIAAFKYFLRGWTDKSFYVALLITKETTDNPELVVIDRDNLLEKDFIGNYINSIRHKIEDKDSYKAFWQVIDQKLAGKKKVYISLDGVYNKINLNTILTLSNKYVFEEKSIIILTNLAELSGLKSRKQTASKVRTAELYGAPKFDYDLSGSPESQQNKTELSLPDGIKNIKIEPLPGSKAEVENIFRILNNNEWIPNLFLNEEATVTQLKKVVHPGLLHIATHGYFLSDVNSQSEKKAFGMNITNTIENPYLRTGLLFAGAEKTINNPYSAGKSYDNGILTAYDVLNLDLDEPELVVLSACETGLGEIQNGEGVYGLQRAFRINGARNIIMSLWKVDDEITNQLMTNFYKNWLGGKSIYDAFRDAQAVIKHEHPDPYYWGGFVIIGE